MGEMMRRVESKPAVATVQAAGPAWARGCEKCQGGLIDAPDASRFTASPYLVRVFQAKNGRLTFCDCQAGNMARQHLRNVWRKIESGEEKLPDAYRQIIEDEVNQPTVHFERIAA